MRLISSKLWRPSLLLLLLMGSQPALSLELIIGEERVSPGIVFIFEGAIKDTINPQGKHLPESQTDVHIEARVNWDDKGIPKGAVPNGFIAYLDVVAEVKNDKTGAVVFVDLLPHINLIDNFHYARNMALPGKRDETYSVKFTVFPPTGLDLALHKDWVQAHGNALLQKHEFSYKRVHFEEIAKATR